MELHKEIAKWLHGFKLIPKTSPCLAPKATIEDLVSVIRDGVVLCQLVHSLDPGCLDMTKVICEGEGEAVSDFVCRNNLFMFIAALVSHFEISSDDVFTQEDLYMCKNIKNVFEVLSKLSHTPKVLKSGIKGFPKKEKQLKERMEAEEHTCEALGQLYAETEYYYQSAVPKVPKENFYSEKYEDIYQKVIPPKAPRLSLSDVTGTLSKKKKKRQAPINELIDTEDKYLENLIMVRDKFREPLTLMSTRDKKIVFYILDELIILHTDILFELKPKKVDIGNVFQRHLPRIKALYGSYCVNLPFAMEHLENLANNSPHLKKQLIDCQATANPSTFPLSSHLVIPFQRFLKYHLLLKEILKHTDEDYYGGSQYSNLQKAVDQMMEACNGVNEKKREYEEVEQQNTKDLSDIKLIQSVSMSIKLMKLEEGVNLLDYGRLRKAGEIDSYNGKTNAFMADYAFLFDMMIVLCYKPKWLQHRYRFKQAFKVKDHYIEPPHLSGSSHCVRLYSRVDPRQVVLTFAVRNQQERDAWFSSFVIAMDAVHPAENESQGHVIQLATFPDNTECFDCHKKLSGKFYQGYKCLRCGANLHKKCLGSYACLEIGTVTMNKRKSRESLHMPTLESESSSMCRSESALSIDAKSRRNSQIHEKIDSINQKNFMEEMEMMPLEDQPWYAGNLSNKVAIDRLDSLPVGTFMVRQRVNGSFALMLKSPEKSQGVKSMKIEVTDSDPPQYYLSHARKFDSIAKMVLFYRNRDLTENFNYESLVGVPLKTPYQEASYVAF